MFLAKSVFVFNLSCIIYKNRVSLRVKKGSAGPVVYSAVMGRVYGKHLGATFVGKGRKLGWAEGDTRLQSPQRLQLTTRGGPQWR